MNEVIGVILSLVVTFGFLVGITFAWISIEEWWANRKV